MTPPNPYLSETLTRMQRQLDEIANQQKEDGRAVTRLQGDVSRLRLDVDKLDSDIREGQRGSKRVLYAILLTLLGLVLSTAWKFVVEGGLAGLGQ